MSTAKICTAQGCILTIKCMAVAIYGMVDSPIFVVPKVQAENLHFQVTCCKIHIPCSIHVQLP